MKISVRNLLLLTTISAASLLGTTAMASDLTVRLAWYMPPHTATDTQGVAIAKQIKALSHGKIDVQTYPAGSFLKESNMAQGLGNNTGNMGIIAMHWLDKYEPELEWDTKHLEVDDAEQLQKELYSRKYER